MSTRRFCDLCERMLTPEDDTPFVRAFSYNTNKDPQLAIGFIMITNEHNHALTDVCSKCKLRVVTEGKPHEVKLPKIATLQQMASKDVAVPVKLFAEPKEPQLSKEPPKPAIPEPIFEPSLPGDRTSPRVIIFPLEWSQRRIS